MTNDLLLPLEFRFSWSWYFAVNLIVAIVASGVFGYVLVRERSRFMRPALLLSLLLNLIYQWPLALFSEVIGRSLSNAWMLALAIHTPVVAGLVWALATSPSAAIAQEKKRYDQGSARPITYVVMLLFLALACVYLSRVGWSCTALHAITIDPESTLLARELSLKLAGTGPATYAYGALANTVAPLLAFLAAMQARAAVVARSWMGGLGWSLCLIGCVLAVMLPGAKGMLVPTLVVIGVGSLVAVDSGYRRLAMLAGVVFLLSILLVGFELVKERKATSGSYPFGQCVLRLDACSDARTLVESLKMRVLSLGLTKHKLSQLESQLYCSCKRQTGAMDKTPSCVSADQGYDGTGTKIAPQAPADGETSLSSRSTSGSTEMEKSPTVETASQVGITSGNVGGLSQIVDHASARALRYAQSLIYRAAVVPLQVATWHFLYVSEHGPPGVYAAPLAYRIFGKSADMPRRVYEIYGSIYSGGDRTSTATAPTSFALAYPAYWGVLGLLVVILAIFVYDLAVMYVLARVRRTLCAAGVGLVVVACLNFVVSDFGTVMLSHGAGAALILLLLLARLDTPTFDGKRLFDVMLGGVLFVGLLPVMFGIWVAVRALLGSPALFRQPRPGRNARLFMLYKFRTMSDERDSEGNLLPDGQRLTKFGRFLRQTSLDELPELYNVMRGDMSLVGPRPLLEEYLPLYTPKHARRHEVKPGLTGWAQVNGRNALRWEEKFDLDVWYVENRTFYLDLKILMRTLLRVLRRDGVNRAGHATVERYAGNQGE